MKSGIKLGKGLILGINGNDLYFVEQQEESKYWWIKKLNLKKGTKENIFQFSLNNCVRRFDYIYGHILMAHGQLWQLGEIYQVIETDVIDFDLSFPERNQIFLKKGGEIYANFKKIGMYLDWEEGSGKVIVHKNEFYFYGNNILTRFSDKSILEFNSYEFEKNYRTGKLIIRDSNNSGTFKLIDLEKFECSYTFKFSETNPVYDYKFGPKDYIFFLVGQQGKEETKMVITKENFEITIEINLPLKIGDYFRFTVSDDFTLISTNEFKHLKLDHKQINLK